MNFSIASKCSESSVVGLIKARFESLCSLMRMWEREDDDQDNGEGDLSLMLCGMTGQQFFGPDQD